MRCDCSMKLALLRLISAGFLRNADLPNSESMKDFEVHVEVQLVSNSPSRQYGFEALQEFMSDDKEPDSILSLENTGQGEFEEPLLLADIALAPLCGDQATYSCDCEACSSEDARHVEGDVQSVQLELQLMMSKADDLQDCLVNGQANLEKEALAAAVPGFLNSCQPYFNQLESAARSLPSEFTSLPTDVCIRRMQLLDFSQQLCDRLEQLVLTYASYDLLCLDETEPHSVSHFFIGQCYMGQLRLSAFLYCKPLPYLAQVDTGLHKRMRWNVDRFTDERQLDRGIKEGKAETVSDTEYYFLCYEDIPPSKSEEDSQGISHCNVVRMWSIGQWVQENPDPNKDNIYDWITCSVPQADYHKLLLLGRDEPSSSTATDFLLQLLLLQHAEGC